VRGSGGIKCLRIRSTDGLLWSTVQYSYSLEFREIWLIKMNLNEAYSKARISKHLSDSFPIQNCFKQGDTLPPNKTNSVALSPRANYTDWETATCRRNLVPIFVDRGVSRGQRGGSPTAVNLNFLDRRYFTIFHVASEYATRKVQENQVGLKLNGIHHLLAYADHVNLPGDNRYYK
jgi:hypothetical protein